MASSDTASTAEKRAHPSLTDLHCYVMDVAANRVGKSANPLTSIDPARPLSIYLGEETIIAGPKNEAAVPIMFRCVRENGAESRHVLVNVKPSVSEQALALQLCQIFHIPVTGKVILEPMVKWTPGMMPFGGGVETSKQILYNLLETVPCADKPLGLPFSELAQVLGASLSGFVDLKVLICEEEFGDCTLCKHKAVLDSIVMRDARTWDIGEGVLCRKCAQRGGVLGDKPKGTKGMD